MGGGGRGVGLYIAAKSQLFKCELNYQDFFWFLFTLCCTIGYEFILMDVTNEGLQSKVKILVKKR
jgi:hypothetical protein